MSLIRKLAFALAFGVALVVSIGQAADLSEDDAVAFADTAAVRLDTRTDETHPVVAGEIVALYGENDWTAPAGGQLCKLTHVEDGVEQGAFFEVADANTVVIGDLDVTTDTMWSSDKTWLVRGTVLVKSGTLTIAPGAKVILAPGGAIREVGGICITDDATMLSGNGAGLHAAESAEVRLDTRTDQVHYTVAGAVESMYGESDWMVPTKSGTYEFCHREENTKYKATYCMVDEETVIVSDEDITADTAWTSNKTWLVRGNVRVLSGILTVQAGTKVLIDGGAAIRQEGGVVQCAGAIFENVVFDGKMDYGEAASAGSVIDVDVGRPLIANQTENICFSSRWEDADDEGVVLSVAATLDSEEVVLVDETGAFEGDYLWEPNEPGYYMFRHLTSTGEMTAEFIVVDTNLTEVVTAVDIVQNTTWHAERTILVDGIVSVKSGCVLTIEPGAVVKFTTGSGIGCEGGAKCIADGVKFTHADDDTIGGDTLVNGLSTPLQDKYTLIGVLGDDTTEYRYHPDPTLTLSGTMSANEVWCGHNVYVVVGNVMVASGVTLTIEPGTIVKFAEGTALTVASGGVLQARGTRAEPIVFTSVNDDSFGSKAAGSSSNPQAGDWDEIRNNGGMIELSNCTILYGGYGQYNNQGDAIVRTTGGQTALDGCVLAHTNLRILGRTGGTVSAVNCVLADGWWGIDGAIGFVNGVIANCLVGSNGGSVTNTIYYDCETYSSSTKVGHCVAYGDTTDVQSGMTYADPLFVDAENGDFRINEGSPCIDAADGDLAPERDYFGQPRITITEQDPTSLQGQLADIGICEVMPRNVASDIDLVAKSVRCETNAVPGQLLFVKWEVANIGGAAVDEPWRDTISLVSEDGSREVALGDKTTVSTIAVGGTAFCSAYFTVPAMAEGKWRPKVNVNSYHDVFEGMLTTNNVLVGGWCGSGLHAGD